MTAVLGISAFYHDSAACLIVNGEIVAAAQEERFTREKHDARFPERAAAFCLARAGLHVSQLDYIAFYDKPLWKFERLLETYLSYAPEGFQSFSKAMPVWLKRKLFMRRNIQKALGKSLRAPVLFLDHHESHAASAFFPSPFEHAAILTIDGVGEWSTATVGAGRGSQVRIEQQLRFPHSLGLLYSAFTYYCGFAVNNGEYKLMGLAPYGQPSYVDLIHEHLIDLQPDGSLWLDMDYFNFCQGLTMTGPRFHELFGGPPRTPDDGLERRHMDLAASIQRITEECVLAMGRHVHRLTGLPDLVLAGGVALNCVGNGRLLREGPFERIWVQPAAGDAGGALGAALFVHHQLLGHSRSVGATDSQQASYLGPSFETDHIEMALNARRARYRRVAHEGDLLAEVAALLADGKIVGWFQDRAEFGPRALGARSILADARRPEMQANLNKKIKFRESFRPFAPCVLREHAHEWFAVRPNEEWPYMLFVAQVAEQHRRPSPDESGNAQQGDADLVRQVNIARSSIPAVTHVDFSARVQTVDERHGRFYRLLRAFHDSTGCPVLVNTSFNLSWEPIVATPDEAYASFMQSELDVLVIEDCILLKEQQALGFQAWNDDRHDLPNTPADTPWADPLTGDALAVDHSRAINLRTGAAYAVEEGIPRLFVPTRPEDLHGRDVTDVVKEFYEETPFPNYDDLDTPRALLEKARRGVFARLLNEQIPHDARVLEVGCGTGQLSNFLGIAHRTVMGVDVCLNSLRLAESFRAAHGLDRVAFAQMNLFRPGLCDSFFDVVISNGVLHHTGDCEGAYRRVSRLVKPGGYLVVGLYNAYSRQLHYARRALYRCTGVTSQWLDPQFRRMRSTGKRDAWFEDQYRHPHETAHTLDELLAWLDKAGFEFINSIPKPAPGPALRVNEDLFQPRDPGSAVSRLASQVAAMRSGYEEGGFFVVIARRLSGVAS